MIYTIQDIARITAPIFEANNVKRAYLFGSYARGEATERSDVDLLAEFAAPAEFRKVLSIGGKLERLLEKEVCFYDVNELKTPSFRDEVMKERVLVYEKA